MIQKPYSISLNNQVIDASKENTVSWKTSGDTSASFSILIYNNSDGTLAWSLPRTYSYAMSYTIPANSIVNGQDYKIAIQVWNAKGDTATSQFVVFTAYSSPVVVVDPIGTVGNHSYLFTASYSQAENDQLSTYTVNLYNSDNSLWKTSGIMTDGLLQYRFDLMKNNTNYYIEFIVTSKRGMSISSGLISLEVIYDNPFMYFELDAITNQDKASVKLNWKISQVIGKTDIEPIYINNDELDVRTGKVFYDEGFEVSDDFTLKVWFNEMILNTDIIKFIGANGSIHLIYKTSDNCFHLYKTVNKWNYHYTYSLPIITAYGAFVYPYQQVEVQGTGTGAFLCVQQKSGRIDMYAENIS